MRAAVPFENSSPAEQQCPIDDEHGPSTHAVMIIKATGVKSRGFSASAITAMTAIVMMFVGRVAAQQQQQQQQTVFRAAAAAGRGPRVYNAFVTSDQPLLPSRADPILTPSFRGPFPWSFYGGWPAVAPLSFAAVPAGPRPDDRRDGPAADPPVPDVPPPPPPVPFVVGEKDKKNDATKPEEYPPAPVGFAV